ncbi:MAG: phosphoribosylformylglycinamidine synthase I [Armatimonadetes bacterium]|nr:phosphoribosylformylglycinamidine synthase I [Armatimonadota bacterium]
MTQNGGPLVVAVVQFPGSNCEAETAQALRAAGCRAEIFRWNREPRELDVFEAFVVGGGFSYQDRVRAGVIAAHEPIVGRLVGLAGEGRPVLGICNGAQVLVEAGMVPGLAGGAVEVALAPNRMTRDGVVVRRDYFCIWTHLRLGCAPERCVFTRAFEREAVAALPIAHGEGRFLSREPGLMEELAAGGQVVWQYCDPDGSVRDEFPTNPNGSTLAIAGMSNPEGNVLALMPHPERASWLRQVPQDLPGRYGAERRAAQGDVRRLESAGPGRKLFESLAHALQPVG